MPWGELATGEPLMEALNDEDASIRCEAEKILRENFGVYFDCNT